MNIGQIRNLRQFKKQASEALDPDIFTYLEGGADDGRTTIRNEEAYEEYQLLPRRMVDVSQIEYATQLLGEVLTAPILLAPLGFQKMFHPEGELASVSAACHHGLQMIVSTVSNYSYERIAAASDLTPWFQLYPTATRDGTSRLIEKVESAGCRVLVLTIDLPVLGNREIHREAIVRATERKQVELGNFEDSKGDEMFNDPSMTWELVDWIRKRSDMSIIVKGVMTPQDAVLAMEKRISGIIVSNHGGRQLESDLGTIECLSDIADVVDKKVPLLIDGGIYRGTDVLKALALGADAVCIGRAFCYALAAYGKPGVEKALEILIEELERNMRLMGIPGVAQITRAIVRKK